MYIDGAIKKYLDKLAARQPTPGGGSAAALCGAMGTALLEMACNFTAGNEKYKVFEEGIKKYLTALKKIRGEFSCLIDEDIKAYSAIREAFKSKDKKNIDTALKDGYDICLKICRLSGDALHIAGSLAGAANLNLITDIGCGVEFLNAAFNSGIFNCEINLKGIGDGDFVKQKTDVLESLQRSVHESYEDAVNKTRERMK